MSSIEEKLRRLKERRQGLPSYPKFRPAARLIETSGKQADFWKLRIAQAVVPSAQTGVVPAGSGTRCFDQVAKGILARQNMDDKVWIIGNSTDRNAEAVHVFLTDTNNRRVVDSWKSRNPRFNPQLGYTVTDNDGTDIVYKVQEMFVVHELYDEYQS